MREVKKLVVSWWVMATSCVYIDLTGYADWEKKQSSRGILERTKYIWKNNFITLIIRALFNILKSVQEF